MIYRCKIRLHTATLALVVALAIPLVWTAYSYAADPPAALLARAKKLHQSGVMMEAVSVYTQYLKQIPDDHEARVSLVELLIDLKRIDEATPHVELLKRRMPRDQRVQKFNHIIAAHQGERKQRRIRQFEEELQAGDAKSMTMIEYARYLAATKMTANAIETYNQYLSGKPDDDQARYELAQQYAWSRQFSACNRELNKLLTTNPRNVQARLLLGDVQYWQGDEERALASYRYALEVSPHSATAKRKVDLIANNPDYRMKQLVAEVTKDPGSPRLNDLAKHYMEVGREYEADSLIQLRLIAAPQDTSAQNIQKEIERRKQERFQKTIAENEERLLRSPHDKQARLSVARYYASIPNYVAALEHYDAYIQNAPMDYNIRLERAYVLNWSGRSKEAVDEFRKVAVALPDNRRARLGLAEALLLENVSMEEAEQIFLTDWQTHPQELRSKLGYADALRRQGKYPEARKMYTEVLAEDSLNQDAQRGIMLLDQDFLPLIRFLEGELQAHPDDDVTRRRLAGLYFDARRYYEAEQLTRELIEHDPTNKRLQAFLIQIEEEKRLYHARELREAQEKVQLHPDDLEARITYAQMLTEHQNLKEAIAQYRLILEQKPGDQAVMVPLAELLMVDKQLKEAADIYQKLAAENPANFGHRFRYAQLLSWIGDNDGALEEYERALRLDPQSIECQIGIANAFRWKGDMYAAHDAYTRILARHPDNSDARKALRELNGPLFRGFEVTSRTGWDSEYYRYAETFAGAIASISLKMQMRAGSGSMYLEQKDLSRKYLFAETGYFLFGKFDYRFDKLTRLSGEIRFYMFQGREKGAYWIELEHNFSDVAELNGLTARLRYSAQDAIFDLASTRSLMTWWEKLGAEKFSIWGLYYPENEPWSMEGELNYIAISDGNSRTDAWAAAGYHFRKYFTVGGRYEMVTSPEQKEAYWSPSDYQTASAWVQLANSFPRWSYRLYGSAGRVLESDDNVRRFSVEFSYRLGARFSLHTAYLMLRTVRKDGEYWYRGLSGSLLINM